MITFNKEDKERVELIAKRGTSPLLCNIDCKTCPMGHFDNSEMSCQEIAQTLFKLFSLPEGKGELDF